VVAIAWVVAGSLAPGESALMHAVGRLHLSDKILHFGAYLVLAALPVLGFQSRRQGLWAGLSMFLLGVVLEAGQHFSPDRSVDFSDVLANGLGVACGVLLALQLTRGRYSTSPTR
jgi:VanZ family protein